MPFVTVNPADGWVAVNSAEGSVAPTVAAVAEAESMYVSMLIGGSLASKTAVNGAATAELSAA